MAAEARLVKQHNKSRRNRSSLAASAICACFYCFKEYPFAQITEWTDGGETAICPRCGVDAVLGFAVPAADQALLRKMHGRWFKTAKRLTPEEWKTATETNNWASSAGSSPDRK